MSESFSSPKPCSPCMTPAPTLVALGSVNAFWRLAVVATAIEKVQAMSLEATFLGVSGNMSLTVACHVS